MEYGKLQGEICAAGHISGTTGAASLVGHPFNLASVVNTGLGTYAVTLSDGVDQLDCAVTVTCDSTPATATANNTGADTDTVKNVAVVDAAGAPTAASGFYIVIVRTN